MDELPEGIEENVEQVTNACSTLVENYLEYTEVIHDSGLCVLGVARDGIGAIIFKGSNAAPMVEFVSKLLYELRL